MNSKSDIGFLSIHESYKLLEVGDNLKQPIYPIWVISSESHYTVLWTNFKISSRIESVRSKYKKIILQHEQTEGCSFINVDTLPVVLSKCELIVDTDYVKFVINELDPDNMGIIFVNDFLNYFSEEDEEENQNANQRNFLMYHYNGRPESNLDNKVRFEKGSAQIIDWQVLGTSETAIDRILQTKWKNCQIDWDRSTPSVT